MEQKQGEIEIRKKWSAESFQKKHECARRQVELYIRELNFRYQEKTGYSFIRYMEARMKTPESIMNKLERKGLDRTARNMEDKLNDVSGVRVICFSIKEIYWIARQISKDEKYRIVKFKDYVRRPKKNGYESFHIVLEVPVGGEDKEEAVRVELQIRTIIMDAWASMDNRISYKKNKKLPPEMEQRIQKYAKIGRRLDKMLQKALDGIK